MDTASRHTDTCPSQTLVHHTVHYADPCLSHFPSHRPLSITLSITQTSVHHTVSPTELCPSHRHLSVKQTPARHTVHHTDICPSHCESHRTLSITQTPVRHTVHHTNICPSHCPSDTCPSPRPMSVALSITDTCPSHRHLSDAGVSHCPCGSVNLPMSLRTFRPQILTPPPAILSIGTCRPQKILHPPNAKSSIEPTHLLRKLSLGVVVFPDGSGH